MSRYKVLCALGHIDEARKQEGAREDEQVCFCDTCGCDLRDTLAASIAPEFCEQMGSVCALPCGRATARALEGFCPYFVMARASLKMADE